MARRTGGMVTQNAAPEDNADGVDVALVTTAPDDWEFETVHDESPTIVMFEEIGETFIGQYAGQKHVEMPPDNDGRDQSFDIYRFRGRDNALYGIYNSYAMDEGMRKVDEGAWVRITFVSEIPAKKGQPMKNLRIDVRTK